MYFPSITTILGVAFLVYIGHSTWLMSQLFTKLKCSSSPCYTSLLNAKPRMQLAIFTSVTRNPISNEVTRVLSIKNFDYWHDFQNQLDIDVPLKTRRNGSLHMLVALALEGEPLEWQTLRRDGLTMMHSLSLTEYMVPRTETFNLLEDAKGIVSENVKYTKSKTSHSNERSLTLAPVTHIVSNVYVSLLTDRISLSTQDVPPEMTHLIHVNRNHQILPILKSDFFNTRMKDLVQVTRNTTKFTINFHFKPIGIGRLRLMLMIEHAMKMIQAVGFSERDVDEVKGIFSDTNVYLLCATVVAASVHVLFDFLSFKNDVIFWRRKQTYEGISTRTTLWRTFSQIVIFLFLLDENTSMLVLVPAGLSTLIEVWKCKKILKLDIRLTWIKRRHTYTLPETKTIGLAEKTTEEFDKQGMMYLSYLLYPLCLSGAFYSLVYEPHKSWYSWTLNSLVNGVYAFGFLFMLPQLFINFKLKSVAALPWRALMYKAFNTFIDDFFAFIITMPTSHRVACLRDDLVFLIYLYQRWLYPVDKTRVDTGLEVRENSQTEPLLDTENEKKNN